MLYLLSPAKTLDYDTPMPPEVAARATTPQFVARSAELIGLLRPKTPAQIASLMDVSDALATLNVARYAAWSRRFTARNSKPAVLAFAGDVYDGLDAATLTLDELDWAQRQLKILSGLYGVLRPLDKLQPYRLEMGTALANPRGRDLYAYWGDDLAKHLNQALARDTRPRVVVNLASQEYARAALRKALKARVVDCVFEEWRPAGWQVIGFFAKRARGAMARHAIRHRLQTPEALTGFAEDGYAHDADASTPDRLVFRRRSA